MAENAADLPEHRFLAAIFLTDDITRVLHSCDDDDNEHVLLSKSRGWCYGISSQRGVGLIRRPGQERRVLRLVCVWELVGETVCTWSARRTMRTTATASTSGVRVADPTRWVT